MSAAFCWLARQPAERKWLCVWRWARDGGVCCANCSWRECSRRWVVAVLGLVVALWIKGGLAAAIPTNIPRFHSMELDGAVLLFAFFLVAVTALIFGLLSGFFIRANQSQSLAQRERPLSPSSWAATISASEQRWSS